MNIRTFKEEFDVVFFTQLRQYIAEARAYTQTPESTRAIDHIEALASNGKRIRPYNTALAYCIYSQKDSWQDIVPVLVGIELIHLFALVHDDVMDKAEHRHGVLTAQEVVKQDIAPKTTQTLAEHISNSEAILIGDLIFSWAYRSLSSYPLSPLAWNTVHKLTEEVTVGQMIDILSPLEKQVSFDIVIQKTLLKTARYSFTRPLYIGAYCAGVDQKSVEWIEAFGDALGLLFQTQDDVLDIVADAQTLKKDPLGDIRNGVHTLLSLYVSEHASSEQKAQWQKWFGASECTDQQAVVAFLTEIGAFAYAEKYIADQKEIAEKTLTNSDIPENAKAEFLQVVSMLTARTH